MNNIENRLDVVDYLISEYKKELHKTKYDQYYEVTRYNISKDRLKRLRLEVTKILQDLEKDCPNKFTKVVE